MVVFNEEDGGGGEEDDCTNKTHWKAQCPRPDERENMVLTEEALLKNDFPEDTEVMLECGNGYEPDSGSGAITCIDGKWTEPDLICKKKDCGPPTPKPNTSFNLSEGTLFGASITVSCDKGYQIRGSSHRKCYASGWSGKVSCEIVRCGKPVEVTNGKISWDSQDVPKYGESVQYVCDEGFHLVGKASIMCTETGVYDSEPPKCEGVTTEDRITTTITPTSATTEQGVRNIVTTVIPEIETTHRDTTVARRATTLPPSLQGGRGILTAGDTDAPPAVTSTTSLQDKHEVAVDATKDNGYVPVIISVICVSLVVCLVALFLHKFLMRKKGFRNGTAPISSRASVRPDRRADRL
ncbi:complement decay-accelerating factor isoform X2 [Cheilinus undulatus]|uniref:complement decay-accelerating factor isoform X2 n=1 Tax=Cheilinus undulatus TaxID=241271 RepID=UPI001BD4335D|nr:complement decay-accelerating factor isoform X2 [Cheilinus undulatus]